MESRCQPITIQFRSKLMGKWGHIIEVVPDVISVFFQQRIEWIWLLEQHPDLYKKAMEYEKDGYTWIQGETLEELSRPERVRQIKLDHIKKQANLKGKNSSGLLVDMFDDDDEIPCANCFI